MGSVPLHYVDLRTFCYATEDETRVRSALEALIPEETPIDRAESTGHHGDRIVVFSTRIETADDIRYVLDRLTEGDVLATIASELDDRVTDNCELFVQLDKQAAYQGRVERGDGIMLRAKIEAYPANPDIAVDNVTTLIEERI